jgi:very-short-patch-repair endonuclease
MLRAMSREHELRVNMTDAERRLRGFKFRRQHRLGPFIADFVCSIAW